MISAILQGPSAISASRIAVPTAERRFAAGSMVHVEVSGEVSAVDSDFIEASDSVSVAGGIKLFVSAISPLERTWTEGQDRRFHELAIKEALEELVSPEEGEELESLTRARRMCQHPLSGEEVLREYKLQQLTQAVIEGLQKYVQFLPARPNTTSRA